MRHEEEEEETEEAEDGKEPGRERDAQRVRKGD